MGPPRSVFLGIVTSSIAIGAACGGTVATQASGSTTGTGGVTSTATTGGSGGAPDAGPDADHRTLCRQVSCVPPEGGACGGCVTSCGPFTSVCADDPSCACVMAHGNAFCPGNAQALGCVQDTGSVSVSCGPCV